MKKIDVHSHVTMWEGEQIRPGVTYVTPEELISMYDEVGIEKGFILSLISPECRFHIHSNREMEYITTKYPDRFYWFCNIDPRMGLNSEKTDFSFYIDYYKNRGAKGIGELAANMYIDDPLMDNLFYHCAECDMPVTIHIAHKIGENYGVVDDLGLPRLERMLKKYPKLKIMGHSQCFWSEMGDNVDETNRMKYVSGKVNEGRVAYLLRNYPNLYCDLSAGSGFNALYRDPDYAYRFIEEFSDRLMFGTDFVMLGQKAELATWLDESFEKGCISEENYKKICRENAIRIFDL